MATFTQSNFDPAKFRSPEMRAETGKSPLEPGAVSGWGIDRVEPPSDTPAESGSKSLIPSVAKGGKGSGRYPAGSGAGGKGGARRGAVTSQGPSPELSATRAANDSGSHQPSAAQIDEYNRLREAHGKGPAPGGRSDVSGSLVSRTADSASGSAEKASMKASAHSADDHDNAFMDHTRASSEHEAAALEARNSPNPSEKTRKEAERHEQRAEQHRVSAKKHADTARALGSTENYWIP